MSRSSLRVTGGSSSKLRPSTSLARTWAASMSSRVTSMYSMAWSPAWAWRTGRWCWCSSAIASMRVRYFSWSRRARACRAWKLSCSAYGFTTASGFSSRCAWRCRAWMSCLFCRASRPASVRRSRWRAWMARVCCAPSSTVSTRQRFISSSSMSMAVVVSISITGPSTWYSCVTSAPDCGSLPVAAIVSSPSDCSSLSA